MGIPISPFKFSFIASSLTHWKIDGDDSLLRIPLLLYNKKNTCKKKKKKKNTCIFLSFNPSITLINCSLDFKKSSKYSKTHLVFISFFLGYFCSMCILPHFSLNYLEVYHPFLVFFLFALTFYKYDWHHNISYLVCQNILTIIKIMPFYGAQKSHHHSRSLN